MRILALLMVLCASCTITVKPLPQTHSQRRHHVVHHRAKHTVTRARSTLVEVDSTWMTNYKQLETDTGHTIPDDIEITPKGGKFSVPQSVVDHFGDMVRARAAAPSLYP